MLRKGKEKWNKLHTDQNPEPGFEVGDYVSGTHTDLEVSDQSHVLSPRYQQKRASEPTIPYHLRPDVPGPSSIRPRLTATSSENFDLLIRMKTYSGDLQFSNERPPAVGEYAEMIAQIKAIVFLATPHRGSDYAQTLQNILKVTPGLSSKHIALQVALAHESFAARLKEFQEAAGMNIKEQKASIIWEKIFEGIMFRMTFPGPLNWVFDGLDEAESPLELIKYLSKAKSSTRINILLISRPRRDLANHISQYFPATQPELLRAEDTLSDIRDFVRASIRRILPGTDEARAEVAEEVICRSSGSFLWVQLALSSIEKNWVLKDDIKAAINEIPEGMEPLYRGIIESIAKQNQRSVDIARHILFWAACCYRPLDISELEVALKPEFDGFTNLEIAIEEICGQFVVINRSKVNLIHHTARQFLLLKTANLPISLDENHSHSHIATVCIDFLSDSTKWRRVFSGLHNMTRAGRAFADAAIFDCHPFLLYALSYWAYHVSLGLVESDELLMKVLAFLENHCLLWIHGVALTERLQILIKAAQNLKTYIKRRAQDFSKRTLKNFSLNRDAELLQWANDLIRVVGRFGNNLAEHPASIHNNVIPFCPLDSIMSRTFLHQIKSNFVVTGLTSNDWSDCLAKISTGEEQTAVHILCKDTFFLTLVGIDGTVIIWYANTCQEARRFSHGEYVTIIASSRTSNLVATSGIDYIRVWDITTGLEVNCMTKDSHHHTRAMAFSPNDDELLVAFDDCVVQCIDLASDKEKWQFLAKEPGANDHNCIRSASFSPDLTRIALIFRGRPVVVWTIQPGRGKSGHYRDQYIPPMKCILAEDKMRTMAQGDAWDPPEIAIWHPVTGHLLVLYEDTRIVAYNLSDVEQEQINHTGARAMVLSLDGNLLLTSDVQGTLSVWTVPEYQLSYQVKYDELVTGLAFSPDSTRFYDIRGEFCHVWEPDALIKASEIEQIERSSCDSNNGDTITTDPVLSNDDTSQVPITSLVFDRSGDYYCCGKEDGSVTIFTVPEGEKSRKVTNHSTSVSIIYIGWSTSSKYLVSADDSGRVIAKRLEPPTATRNRWAVFPVFDVRMENAEAVELCLFHPKDLYLLIVTPTQAYIMNLNPKKSTEVCRQRIAPGSVWINHPVDVGLLLRIDAGTEQAYHWKTLEPCEPTPQSNPQRSGGRAISIAHTVQTRDFLLLETLVRDEFRARDHRQLQTREVVIIELSRISSGIPGEHRVVVEGLSKHVNRLIGEVDDRVVFLDHHFWLCTWEIEATYTGHKKHFFLPRDWISPQSLRQIALHEHGIVLIPKNGEVAVVKASWIDLIKFKPPTSFLLDTKTYKHATPTMDIYVISPSNLLDSWTALALISQNHLYTILHDL
ncbi:putative Vegetative incompatibility protein HET-E-1 [Glarea lozoyensis 74030]|uniref:Putative Vegetative incompatibility protein HET-E-1 n=1 Tax=Glarea lozoyensis (strain ATCC 74030 / MF5533) TaxID=1104152 RepID=H0EKD0_GLAL7|nr:putative Vegetative incompatibility protein HET-E-1 [Glarea lozoyensis 74030]